MLVLTRKIGEVIMVGEDIKITITDIKGNRVRVGIDAPKEIPVNRIEVLESKKNDI